MAPCKLTSQGKGRKASHLFLNTELTWVVGENKGLSEHTLDGTPTFFPLRAWAGRNILLQ